MVADRLPERWLDWAALVCLCGAVGLALHVALALAGLLAWTVPASLVAGMAAGTLLGRWRRGAWPWRAPRRDMPGPDPADRAMVRLVALFDRELSAAQLARIDAVMRAWRDRAWRDPQGFVVALERAAGVRSLHPAGRPGED